MKTSLLIKIIAGVVILAGVGYFVFTNYVSKEEKEKIIQVYKDVNKVGIKSYNYVLLMKALIRLLIYAIVMNMMVNLL